MQKLTEHDGVPTTLKALRQLELRLRRKTPLGGFADEVGAMRRQLRERLDRWEETVELRIAATAQLEWCDEAEDDAVASVARLALHLARGDRAAEPYRSLFPTAASSLRRMMATPEQARFVDNLLLGLAHHPELAHERTALQHAHGEVAAARAERDAAYAAEALARAELANEAHDCRRAHTRLYHHLLADGETQAFVEWVFRRSKTERAEDAPTG